MWPSHTLSVLGWEAVPCAAERLAMGLGAAVERVWDKVRGIEAGATDGKASERKTMVGSAGLGYNGGALLTPFRSQGTANGLPKPTTANLRRLAETPAARRAINCIKDQIASMDWRIEVGWGPGHSPLCPDHRTDGRGRADASAGSGADVRAA